jgi:hypothetical protein
MRITRTILFLALVLTGCEATTSSVKSDSDEVAIKPQDIQFVDQRVALANALTQAAARSFEASMVELERVTAGKINRAAIGAAEKAAELDEIRQTVYLLAKDKFKGTTEAESHLADIIGPTVSPVMLSMAKETDKRLAQLEVEQRKISLDLAADLLASNSPKVLAKRVNSSEPQTEIEFNHALHALGANGTYVGVRIAYNTTTVLAPGIVQSALQPVIAIGTRLFATSVARLVGTGTAAIFEGPLPVAKILLGISIGWTAYEITRLQPKYRKEVATSLQESLEARKIKHFGQARQQAKTMVGSFEKLNFAMRAQVLAK